MMTMMIVTLVTTIMSFHMSYSSVSVFNTGLVYIYVYVMKKKYYKSELYDTFTLLCLNFNLNLGI